MKKHIRPVIILLIWIALWQLAAAAIGNKIIFVGPWEAAGALAAQAGTAEFWRTVLSSFLRIASGFLGAFLSGILLAAAAGRFPLIQEFLEPFLGLLQSVPVASFVILALIWIGSANLSILITFLVVLPVIYRNMLEGIRHVDGKMLEMADVFHMSLLRRLLYLYRPTLMPYLQAGCRISLGMAWKSGVAAEVIGVPAHSIGEKLYMAKIYLSTGELFAWTFVIILVSKLFEKCFLFLLYLASADLHPAATKQGRERSCASFARRAFSHRRRCFLYENKHGHDGFAPNTGNIRVEQVGKAYLNKRIFSNLSITLKPGHIYCLMGPSGCGKTTLLRIIMGLETPDQGSLSGLEHKKISAVFQEDRLCEFLDAVKNVQLVSQQMIPAEPLLERLLEPEALHRPVAQLSGGMKRRVSIARALLAPSDVILMDEPFTGLDETARENAIRVIRDNLIGRPLLLVTHREEDAALLKAELLTPFSS